MANGGECRVYERIAASGVTDGFIRPGGVALTERALSLCAFAPGSRLLDVGCGTGTMVEHLNQRFGFFTAGVDPSLPMIAKGHARNSLPTLRASSGREPALPGCPMGRRSRGMQPLALRKFSRVSPGVLPRSKGRRQADLERRVRPECGSHPGTSRTIHGLLPHRSIVR